MPEVRISASRKMPWTLHDTLKGGRSGHRSDLRLRPKASEHKGASRPGEPNAKETRATLRHTLATCGAGYAPRPSRSSCWWRPETVGATLREI